VKHSTCDTQRVDVDGYSTDLYADAAVDFIRRNARERFFLYVPFNAPCYNGLKNVPPGEEHQIWQVPDDVLASYGPGAVTDQRLRYAAVITALDRAVGRILAQLDQQGLRENTLVIWWSDNGAFLMNEGVGLGVASNAPLHSGGTQLWEGGIRVPGIVCWPGVIRPDTITEEPLIAMDFFALVLAAAGVPRPAGRIIDGVDPTLALLGKRLPAESDLFWEFRAQSAMRQGQFKLLRLKPEAPWQLYDLAADEAEQDDLAGRQPARVQLLAERFERWRENCVTHP
jgi:arylsulfatase A